MIVYNYSTKEWESYDSDTHVRGIINIGKFIEYGFFELNHNSIPIEFNNNCYFLFDYHTCTVPLFYRNDIGMYSLVRMHQNNIKRISRLCWNYPIQKCYNFSKLNIPKKAIESKPEEFKTISDFTVGVEYETAAGNIPWLDCLSNNLVPLYDGSITGHEYVTFPLSYDELYTIKDHLKVLESYTYYDKNCSLHIHFGGFPIKYRYIDGLMKIWKKFQFKLLKYIPYWSYEVEQYKDNGKAYNKPITVDSLKLFYEGTTDNNYEDDNSFYLPNRYDADEVRKWEVHGRYYNMNIMHLISGNDHKTVEFRFLRPTTNYVEIKWYILILGNFLKYVLREDAICDITVPELINLSFTGKEKEYMHKIAKILHNLHKIQITNCDYGGINSKLKTYYLSKHEVFCS